MASTLVITLKSARTQSDLNRFIKDTSEPRDQARALEQLFGRLKGGLESGSFDVQTSANAPVRASGTITLTYASIVAGTDTVTVAGVVLTSSASTTDATHWKKVTDGPTTATNLATCINTNTTLNKYLSASAAASVVTLTCLVPGTIGDTLTLASSNGTGAAVSGSTLASGAGGCETVAVNFSRGL